MQRLFREMLRDNRLREETFLKYAMRMYDNPHCKNVVEFEEDLNRIKYIKRLLNKYKEKNTLRGRLLLNHTIILNNVFGVVPTARILFYKLESSLHPALKTLLDYLLMLPESIPEAELDKIPFDPKLEKMLKEIECPNPEQN